MKTTNILESAMVVFAIAFSFCACDNHVDNPKEDTKIVSSVVTTTTTISRDFTRVSTIQLLADGEVIKTFTADDTVCTMTNTIKDFPQSVTYVLDGKLNADAVDTTSKYTFDYHFAYTITSYNAAGEKVAEKPASVTSGSFTYSGKKVAKFIEAFFPFTLRKVEVTNQ